MKTVGIIPARLESTRLPGKLLLARTGKPLIQYVWEAAKRAQSLEEVIVATNSAEIAKTVIAFGGRAELTGEHPSGTDRVADVVRRCGEDAEIVVNLQGDEPELDPEHIDRLVESLKRNPDDEMATLATPLTSAADVRNPNCVKVVCAADGRAVYFSRSPIPHWRGIEPEEVLEDAADQRRTKPPARCPSGRSPGTPWLLHLGLYAYRREFLLRLTGLPPSPLEQLEKLEQLRALEAGATIRVAIVENACVGIDTPDDYARFVRRQLSAARRRLPKSA